MSIKTLIVDDSFLMRNTIRKILESAPDFSIIKEAQNGEEALNMIKEDDFHVILLDIEMPKMDGIEFMKRCKIHSEAPIIVISSLGNINSPLVDKALHFGAFDVISKPRGVLTASLNESKTEEIFSTINRALKRRV